MMGIEGHEKKSISLVWQVGIFTRRKGFVYDGIDIFWITDILGSACQSHANGPRLV